MQKDKVITDNDICVTCKWFFGLNTCQAFPNGIPDAIMFGENQHSEPMPNQGNNIVYEILKSE